MFYKETSFKQEPSIGEIPRAWSSAHVGEAVEVHDSKRIPLSEIDRSKRKGGYPYCGANGIIDYIDDYIFDGEYVLLAEDGGSYGKFENTTYIMKGKFWVNNHAHILQAVESKTSNQFLKYVLDFMDMNPYIVGTTRKKLNQEQMKKIRMPLPSLDEQRGIVEVLSCVDLAIQKIVEVIAKTERLKKGLMQKLLTEGIGHKEFKDAETGKIPKTWDIKRVGDIAKVTVGYVGPISDSYTDKENGIPLLSTTNITENGMRLEDLKYVTQEFHEKNRKSRVSSGVILIARHGASGCASVVPESLREAQCLNVVIVRPSNNIEPRFIEYLFNLASIRNRLSGWKSGSVQGVVNTGVMERFAVPVPPFSEQEEIVKILSTIRRKLQLGINEKAKLSSIKQGLMDLLLTGRVRIKVG
jgi:type I restriction enzyme S subunit